MEREREVDRYVCVYVCVYVYIYMHTYIHTDTQVLRSDAMLQRAMIIMYMGIDYGFTNYSFRKTNLMLNNISPEG